MTSGDFLGESLQWQAQHLSACIVLLIKVKTPSKISLKERVLMFKTAGSPSLTTF